MAKDVIKVDGVILEALGNANFKVQVENENNSVILAHLSGKMKLNKIMVVPGDKVTIEMSPYDLTKGRISIRK